MSSIGNANKPWYHKALLLFLSSLKSPLSLATFFGPIIVLKLSFLFLKERLRDNPSAYPELKGIVLENSWTEPMAEYHVQLIVLILVFIFALGEVLGKFFEISKDHSLNEIRNKIYENTATLSFVVLTLVFIFAGIFLFAFGAFASPHNILLFKENSEYYSGWGMHPPPLNSNITWARAFILFIFSPISNYLLNKKMPEIFNSNK